ncbi:hypothetical protein B9Z55_004932 [Caenorhabditis nigoni]|uniref:Uncharacterized protein n=1 Tax=Caenorhabditis nigoni TaxID=1611254 RepID=A0A2G5UZD1_9PELO|nr:hypothetical protein B9Z55_004932 [Caenorhabditis nigoni]
MFFPTLFQLAAKAVAQQIHNDSIPIDFNFDTKSSNEVVRHLLELDPKNIVKLKTHGSQLSRLTELDLSECEIDVEGISNLKKFNLISLEFGDWYHLRTEFPHPTNSSGIDIVSLLERALKSDSQKMMVHLGFTGEMEDLMMGWERNISKLLPSLQSITIIADLIEEQRWFSKFCHTFPNLRVLDISYVESLKGIKHLKNLQKLVMGYELDEDVYGYNELSELKNLRVLDVSGESIEIISSLLQAEVRIENLEFLDCSMTLVEDHELKEFVKCHPKLKTVVAISTECNNSYIPTIDLLNFNSHDSTMKSLKYALSNGRDEPAEACVQFITDKLIKFPKQLIDSEIRELINALSYVLRETEDQSTKHLAIFCFGKSSFFETKRFFNLFWLEIPGIVELIFKSWESFKWSGMKRTAVPFILSVFKRIVEFLRFGRVFQDRLMYSIIEKTIELSCQYPENIRKVTFILIEAHRFMSLEQSTVMCNNKKVMEGLFEYAQIFIKHNTFSNHRIMETIASYLNQASENTLKHLVSNCQAVEKCYEQVMKISSKHSQKNLSQIVLRLMTVINQDDEKALTFMACSILSLLLAKNLTDDRVYVNSIIEEFNNSWVRSNILDCQYTTEVLDAIFTSKHSTDTLIRFGLILMSNFIHAKKFESREYWNWIQTTSAGVQNNEKWTKKTRDSASAVLYEMAMIKKKWWCPLL